MIEEFCKDFDFEIKGNIVEINNGFYLSNELLEEVRNKNSEKPKNVGIFLGEVKKGRFSPSIPLLKMINKHTKKKIIVDKKAAWLFICGRDIMERSVIKSEVSKGLCIVQDESGDFLGLAKIEKKKDIFANNVIDLGDYIRREK
ncbi:hypothetical protein C0585_05820 [Candidatus Woesearchaeota archaeon]|nr:MAG: hypothetical protein C0585_05820 [Candidatus Woesearchaeota archaeon]